MSVGVRIWSGSLSMISSYADHVATEECAGHTPVVTKPRPRQRVQIKPLEWGDDGEDGFFLLALVSTVPPLEVKFDFVRSGRTIVLDGIEILVADRTPKEGITSDVYRAVPLGRAHAVATSLIAAGTLPRQSSLHDQPDMPPAGWIDPQESPQRSGRHSLTDLFLAQVADCYVKHVQSGHPKPVEAVALEMGSLTNTVSTSWLPKAGSRGLLLGRERGKVGGYLSNEALAVLASARRKGSSDGPR